MLAAGRELAMIDINVINTPEEESTPHFDTPDVETLHSLLSDMTVVPISSAQSCSESTSHISASTPPPLNLWTHLPLELREKILSHLLSSLLNESLHIFANSSRTNAPTTNPLLSTLEALIATSSIFRTDLRVPLKTLCADVTRRWHRILRDAHARLYEHVDAQFAMGFVIEDVFSVEEALRKCSYAGNEYYQSVATRVLYGEPGGLSDGMLGRVAAGWEGMLRIWWELEGRSDDDFLDWHDEIFNRRWTMREAHREATKAKRVEPTRRSLS